MLFRSKELAPSAFFGHVKGAFTGADNAKKGYFHEAEGGTFDWEKSGKFPDFTEPDESYHGVVYTREFGKMAYIIKARMQLMRDFGCYPAAHSAFLLNLGLETLPVRMKQYCENAMTVAKMLKESDKIASVTYPGLPDDQIGRAHV